jgi:hypothetical protein
MYAACPLLEPVFGLPLQKNRKDVSSRFAGRNVCFLVCGSMRGCYAQAFLSIG